MLTGRLPAGHTAVQNARQRRRRLSDALHDVVQVHIGPNDNLNFIETRVLRDERVNLFGRLTRQRDAVPFEHLVACEIMKI